MAGSKSQAGQSGPDSYEAQPTVGVRVRCVLGKPGRAEILSPAGSLHLTRVDRVHGNHPHRRPPRFVGAHLGSGSPGRSHRYERVASDGGRSCPSTSLYAHHHLPSGSPPSPKPERDNAARRRTVATERRRRHGAARAWSRFAYATRHDAPARAEGVDTDARRQLPAWYVVGGTAGNRQDAHHPCLGG